MEVEAFRASVLSRLDALLLMWVVCGADRAMLTALRRFTAEMPADDVTRFQRYVDESKPKRASEMDEYAGLLKLPADPMAGVDVLIAYYKGDSVPLTEVGHAALHIIAYAYGQIDPHERAAMSAEAVAARHEPGECLAALEACRARCAAVGVGSPVTFADFKGVLKIALPLIFQFLNQLLS